MKLRLRWLLLMIVLVFCVARLLAPSFIRDYANKRLNEIPGYKGHVEKVVLHVYRGAYSLYDLKLEKERGQKTYPFLYVQEVEFSVQWKELLHRRIVGNAFIIHPVVHFTTGQTTAENQKEVSGPMKEKGKSLVPLDINHLVVEDASVYFHALNKKPVVNMYVKKLYVEAENLRNTPAKKGDLYATIKAHGVAMDSGKLEVSAKADPNAKPPSFKVNAQIEDLNLKALNPFFTAYGDFDVAQGDFSLYTEVATDHERVEGYVKPVFKNVEVARWQKDKGKGLFHYLWENVVGTAFAVLKNQPKDQQAAKIPFTGNLDNPKVDIWAAIGSVLQNAFVRALVPNIEHSVSLNDVKKKK